eukprot:132679_1
MSEISVANDITDKVTNAYKDYIVDELNSIVGEINHTIYINFAFDIDQDLEYGDSFFIYNGGTLSMDSFYIYGAGAHQTIIYSPGSLDIDGMVTYPDTYCTHEQECQYDAQALQVQNWISFAEANTAYSILTISNCHLYGNNGVAFDFNYGFVFMYNVTLEMATYGVFLSNNDIELEIDSCVFKNIGPYYGSPNHALYALDPTVQPFYLYSKYVRIKDSVFSFVDPYQFHLFSSDFYGDSDTVSREIQLIGNSFELSDVDVLYPYPLNHTLDHNPDLDLNQYFVVHGWLRIPNHANATLINNAFVLNDKNRFVTEDILIEYAMANIYVTNVNGTTCISGLKGTNLALWIQNGNVSSCVKPEMIDYFDIDDCQSYGSFGGTDNDALGHNDGAPNIFNINNNISSIIEVESGAFVSLHHNVINPQQPNLNLLYIENGNYLLTDTIINETYDYDIRIRPHCAPLCVSLIDNDPHQMTIFHALCNESKRDDPFRSLYDEDNQHLIHTTNHWMPWYIHIDSITDEYFAGGQLELTYSIYDIDHNNISNYNKDITIDLESTNEDELFAKFQLYIDKSGECQGCNVYLQTCTIDMTGSPYALKPSVFNGDLLVNSFINFTVIECPSGYGLSTTAKQCEECKIYYANLVPTNTSCFKCDEDVDGVFCRGSNHIITQKSHWMAVYGYNNALDDLYFISNNATHYNPIISGRCPPGYCCDVDAGCDYMYETSSLCAAHRNASVPLCGRCEYGYSELFGSAKCGACDHSNLYLMLYPIIIGLGWSLVILITKSSPSKKKTHPKNRETKCHALHSCCTKCKGYFQAIKSLCSPKCAKCKQDKTTHKPITKDDFMNTLEVMIIINMAYYYQTIINLVSLDNGVPTSLIAFANLFDMNVFSMIPSDTDSDKEQCLFKNMTALHKILSALSTTAMIILL